MRRNSEAPVFLNLLKGRAVLVFGSGRDNNIPLYEYDDGERVAVDTRIPDDLAGRWIWMGPWLSCGGVAICTVSYPPPLCYDQARAHERAMERLDAQDAPRQLMMELG